MHEHDYTPTLTRRTILRSGAAALTLPWLSSLAWAEGGKAAESAGPPRRWAGLVFGNGVLPDRWWAKGDGDAMQLSDLLEPLSPHKRDVLFLDNMVLVKDPPYRVPHGTHYTNMLSGHPVQRAAILRMAMSVDQYMAKVLGANTPVPALNLGLRAGNPRGVMYDTISWASATSPVMPEAYPQQAFDRLFDVKGLVEKKSILDDVIEQTRKVRGEVSAADQRKLDKYLESVRDVEKRIEAAVKDERAAGDWRPTLDKPDIARPETGRPREVPDYMKLMLDLMVLGFQMDRTRIGTLQFNNDGTNYMQFGFLDGVPNKEMHSISHHGDDAERKEHHAKVIRYHVQQLAYFMSRLRDIDEGPTTLLDNTMIYFGSNFIDGHRHDTSRVPILLAGGGSMLKTGRVLNVTHDEDRYASNLFLAMINRMGIPDASFGDSTRPLQGLI